MTGRVGLPHGQDGFGLLVCVEPRLSDLRELASGQVGAIKIRQAMPLVRCGEIAQAAKPDLFELYNLERHEFPLYRLGPALNDFRDGSSISPAYWQAVRRARHMWSTELQSADCHDFARSIVSRMVPGPVLPAKLLGEPLYWGILRRVLEGSLTHWDDVRIELGEMAPSLGIEAQLAFNLYVVGPATGGAVVVWDRTWSPDDEHFRDGHDYRPALFDGHRMIRVPVGPGDIIIFNSRNYHRVEPVGSGDRLTFSFFLGLRESEGATLWS